MTPDSPESRIGRLETHVARLEQRVEDLSTDVRALTPLVIAHAEMRVVLDHMQTQLTAAVGEAQTARKELGDLRSHLESVAAAERKEREVEIESRRKERKSDRRYLIATMLTAAALIIATIQVLGVPA